LQQLIDGISGDTRLAVRPGLDHQRQLLVVA